MRNIRVLESMKGVLSGTQLADTSLVVKTYQWVLASLLATIFGTYLGLQYHTTISNIQIPLLVGYILVVIGMAFLSNKRPINAILLFSMTLLLGLLISIPIHFIVNNLSNGVEIILNTALLTLVATTGLSLYAIKSQRNFSAMRGALFIVFLVYFVAGLLNAFWLQMPLLHLFLSATGVIIFSLFLLIDTQSVINRELGEANPIFYAILIYLDIVNIFINLLSLMTSFLGEKD